MATDPVCGMSVDERTAQHVSEYEGVKYYFCSSGCKAKFGHAPQQFLAPGHTPEGMHGHTQHIQIEPLHSPKRATGASGKAMYICPMHPYITMDHAGRCPECGMRMERATGDAEAAHGEHAGHERNAVTDFTRRFWVSLVLTVPIMLLSPMIQHWLGLGVSLRFPGDAFLLLALSTVVYVYGGWPFLEGLYGEVRAKNPGMMSLVALAISIAYVYSTLVVFGLPGMTFFWELASLLDIMLIGHVIEMRSVMGASKALEELAKLMPSIAHRIGADNRSEDVPLSALNVGDRVLVKPGEKIPADGLVQSGTTTVDEAMLTGESTPVEKQAGSTVIGGSINGEGSLTVEVRKTGNDSFVAQVVELVNESQKTKSRTQDLANRAALALTIIAIVGGLATLVVWYGFIGRDFAFSLERTVTVMVIACPHALGLAIPLVVAVSTALSAKRGLLIRNRRAFEVARNIQAVIFDKTGTLTEGRFGIADIVILDDALTTDNLLTLAASVESHSEHPIAKAIVASAKKVQQVRDFRAIPGKGAEGIVDGRNVKVVSPGYLQERKIEIDDERIARLSSEGKTVVYVLIDGVLKGAFALADIVRSESSRAITKLKEMGIRCMMLTGDNAQVAARVSKEIGIDEYFAGVLPHEKANKVKEVQARGFTVAMAGDGVNDAPALAQSDVGIAIGAGTDVAIATADIVLVRSNPLDVVAAIELARVTYKKMVQNLAWATGYNAITIPLAAGVLAAYGILLSPAVGAILMSISTVIVAINARIIRF